MKMMNQLLSMLFFTCIVLPGFTQSKHTVNLYPGNPFYWQVNGKPLLLLGGSSAPKDLLNDEGMFLWPDVTGALDKLAESGGDYTRCLMSGRLRDGAIWPFKQKGNRFDLEQWDEEYWRLFETFLRETDKRGIITDIEIWATFDYAREPWTKNPFNPENNMNYTEEQTGIPKTVDSHPVFAKNRFYRTVPGEMNISEVLRYQQRFVDKILSYTLKYGNVLYCMDNEIRASPEWCAYWASYVREAARKAGKHVFITEMFEPHDLSYPIYDNVIGNPELYDFIEISQNNHQTSQTHYDKIQEVRSRILAAPRPLSNVKIYGVDGRNRFGSSKEGMVRFWQNIFGGCASARFHEKHLGDSDLALQMIRSAREITASFDLFHSAPNNGLLKNRETGEACCLANPGKEYAVYFPSGGEAQLEISITGSEGEILWYDIEAGAWADSTTFRGKKRVSLAAPSSGQWVAIVRIAQAAQMTSPDETRMDYSGYNDAQDYMVPLFCNSANGTVSLNQWKIVPSMATWHMDSVLIDLAATYSTFRVLANLRNSPFRVRMNSDKDLMHNELHDQIKKRVQYAKEKGISLIADLDVRLALQTFEARYPDELQQMLVVREIKLNGKDTVNVSVPSRTLQDHYHRPYPVRSGSFVKAFKYNLTREGLIDPISLKEISEEYIVNSFTKESVQLKVPENMLNSSSHIFVMVSFTYLYPDVFSPHLMEFRNEIVRKYADTGLAGAHNDEWGFPNAISEWSVQNEYWYTGNRAKVYAENTDGRDLLNDILLMHKGIAGKEAERIKAINYFQEMGRVRNGELEEHFYYTVKDVFGPDAIVAVHPTWFPYPERREFKKNGLDWWIAKRDWAQTDEVTPFGVRTSLAKKWDSPVWYNMDHTTGLPPQTLINADLFVQSLWSSALAGGRVTNLPSAVGPRGILGSDFIKAETRIRLLNYITESPLNCPVAVIFGHTAAMNWAGKGFEDIGMDLVNELWLKGIPTDLIPTSEIWNKSLFIDNDGFVCYGKQRYAAVILYNPEFEKESTASFFIKASNGNTRLLG